MSKEELKKILNNVPDWWGNENKEIYDNLIFMVPPTTFAEVFNEIGEPKEELEKIKNYEKAIFWSISRKDYQKINWWSKTASAEISNKLTIRTVNTVRKIKSEYNCSLKSKYKEHYKMIEVKFYDTVDDNLLKFVVIIAKTNGKWVFCKHKERDTYEIPGGHRENGEDILTAAKRELREETGAIDFTIQSICVYSVKGKTRVSESSDENETFGMLFIADISSFGELHTEIEKILITDNLVDNWTYPMIQPKLLKEAENRGYL